MRELKFKAYHKIGKKWFCYCVDAIELNNPEGTIKNIFIGVDAGTPLNRNTVLVQYIGLHDKNGTEIYDGDIVKLTKLKGFGQDEKWSFIGKVFWANGSYMAINKNGQSVEALFGNYTQMEHIGTIYENPEMLEGR